MTDDYHEERNMNLNENYSRKVINFWCFKLPSQEMLSLIFMGIEMLLFDKRVLKNVSVEFTIKPPYIVINLFKVYDKKINA